MNLLSWGAPGGAGGSVIEWLRGFCLLRNLAIRLSTQLDNRKTRCETMSEVEWTSTSPKNKLSFMLDMYDVELRWIVSDGKWVWDEKWCLRRKGKYSRNHTFTDCTCLKWKKAVAEFLEAERIVKTERVERS